MKNKLLVINPVGHDAWDREIKDYLEPYKEGRYPVGCGQPETGPAAASGISLL